MTPANRLIVHVGAPKCGSSSLQTALSRNPAFKSSLGLEYRYAAILAEGRLVTGSDLYDAGINSLEGFVRSADIHDLKQLDQCRIDHLVDGLNNLVLDTNVILSCEGWLQRYDEFSALNLLRRIKAPVEILAYVRPQPDYLNAHWWQWGAWAAPEPEFLPWVYHTEQSTWSWAALVQKWAASDGIAAVTARVLPVDVVTDFFRMLSCDVPSLPAVNRALPAVALRFLQRHRDLRPHSHASEINFILERALKSGGSAPWVLPLRHVAHILALCRADNMALMDILSASDHAIMQADPRWWDASVYENRIVETPEKVAPVAEEIDEFAAELARALLMSEKENLRLRAELMRQVRSMNT